MQRDHFAGVPRTDLGYKYVRKEKSKERGRKSFIKKLLHLKPKLLRLILPTTDNMYVIIVLPASSRHARHRLCVCWDLLAT